MKSLGVGGSMTQIDLNNSQIMRLAQTQEINSQKNSQVALIKIKTQIKGNSWILNLGNLEKFLIKDTEK